MAGKYGVTGSTYQQNGGDVNFTGIIESVGSSLDIGNFGDFTPGTLNFNSAAVRTMQTLTMGVGTLDAGNITVAGQFIWYGLGGVSGWHRNDDRRE